MRARRGDDEAILAPARSITMPRRRTSSARSSGGVSHTLLPISTIDWCSSGLTSPSIM